MSDRVGISNMALFNIGQKRINSLDDPGASAAACKLRYDEARREALAAALWGFASLWWTGVPVAITPKPGWAYVHAFPNDALAVLSIWHLQGTDPPPFEVTARPDGGTGKLIHSNEETPTFVGVRDISDTSTFEVLFEQALAWLLASKIAMPITKNIKVQQQCWAMWVGLRDQAIVATQSQGFQPDDRAGFYHEAAGLGGTGGTDQYGRPLILGS